MQQNRNFSGVIAPILTPFTRDGSPDPDRYVDHARWLLANGCSALAPFGTTSEATSLGLEERMELLEQLIDAGIEPSLLLVGTGMCSVTDAAVLTRHAVDSGCGGVLMLPPFYYKNPSDDGVFAYYARVIDEVADEHLRIYLYHYPQLSAVPLSLALIGRLISSYPTTVIGLKDSSGDEKNLHSALSAYPQLEVFPGTEKLMLTGLRAGAAGVISASANLACAQLHGLFRSWQAPDASQLQQAIGEMRTTLDGYPAIPALKALLAQYRNDPEWATVRPPLVELDSADAVGLAAVLVKKHGFSLQIK